MQMANLSIKGHGIRRSGATPSPESISLRKQSPILPPNCLLLGEDDRVSHCLIEDCYIYSDTMEVVFIGCNILDSKRKPKKRTFPKTRCPIIDNCILKNCNIPKAWYSESVVFEDGKKEKIYVNGKIQTKKQIYQQFYPDCMEVEK